MRDNWLECVCTRRLLLQPYRRALVPAYHAWMRDEALRASTSSDALTFAEELAAQRAWRDDASKCTFIVFDRAEHEGARGDGGGGAGGGVGISSGDNVSTAGMCGDVNLFLLDAADVRDAYFGGAAGAGGGAAEVMVMVADVRYRRRGYAAEATRALMRYGAARLGLRRFVAKIDAGNAPSLALFAALGFAVAKRVDAFHELHLVRELRGDDAAADAGAVGDDAWAVVPWPHGAEGEDEDAPLDDGARTP
jgi:RimJ/RimL family protein N-acetyltransferase